MKALHPTESSEFGKDGLWGRIRGLLGVLLIGTGLLADRVAGQDALSPSFGSPYPITLDDGRTYQIYPDPAQPTRFYYLPDSVPIARTPDGGPDVRIVQYLIRDDGPERAGAYLRVGIAFDDLASGDVPVQIARKLAEGPNKLEPLDRLISSSRYYGLSYQRRSRGYPARTTATGVAWPSHFDPSRIKTLTDPSDLFQSEPLVLMQMAETLNHWEYMFSHRTSNHKPNTKPGYVHVFEIFDEMPVWRVSLQQAFPRLFSPFFLGGDGAPLEVVPLPITEGTFQFDHSGTGQAASVELSSAPATDLVAQNLWYNGFRDRLLSPSPDSARTLVLQGVLERGEPAMFEGVIRAGRPLPGVLKLKANLPLGFPKRDAADWVQKWGEIEEAFIDSALEDGPLFDVWDPKKLQQFSYPIDPLKLVRDWVEEMRTREFLYDYEKEWLVRIHAEWKTAMLPENGGYRPAEREIILWEELLPKPVKARPWKPIAPFSTFARDDFATVWQEGVRMLWLRRALVFLFQVKTERAVLAGEPVAVWTHRASRWGRSFGMIYPRILHAEKLRLAEPQLTLLRFLTPTGFELKRSGDGVWSHPDLNDSNWGISDHYTMAHWDTYQRAIQALRGEEVTPPASHWVEVYQNSWLGSLDESDRKDLESEITGYFEELAEVAAKPNSLATAEVRTTATIRVQPSEIRPVLINERGQNSPPVLALPDLSGDAAALGLKTFYLRPGLEFLIEPSNPAQANFERNFLSALAPSPEQALSPEGTLLPHSVQRFRKPDGRTQVLVWWHPIQWNEVSGWSIGGKRQLRYQILELGKAGDWFPELASNEQDYTSRFLLYKTARSVSEDDLSYQVPERLFSGSHLVNLPSLELDSINIDVRAWSTVLPEVISGQLKAIEVNLFHDPSRPAKQFLITKETRNNPRKWIHTRERVNPTQSFVRAEVFFVMADGTRKPWSKNGVNLADEWGVVRLSDSDWR